MEKTYIITNRTGAVNMLNEYINTREFGAVPEQLFDEMVNIMFDGTHYIVDHEVLALIYKALPKLMAQLH